MTPVYDWDDKLNKRVCIGYSIFDGRDGLLPDRGTVTPQHLRNPDGKAGRAKAREANALPSQREVGDPHAYQYSKKRSICRHCRKVTRQGARICGRCLGKARWAA